MGEQYFLGANSRAGFQSLYRYFAAAEGEVLHVIKGGPGTGKSSFMRRIAAAARERGLEVDEVLCSGDPGSLDGVYVPALRQGWVDGTAPHTLDVRRFGVDGDYLDLGRFCRLPLPEDEQKRAGELYDAYRARYAAAYQDLAAAGALREAAGEEMDTALAMRLEQRLEGILRRCAPRPQKPGQETARYLSAICGDGLLRLPLDERYGLVYVLHDERGLAAQTLRLAASLAAARGLERIRCPSPLDAGKSEALLLPEAGVAFTAFETTAAHTRHIRLDSMGQPMSREERAKLRQTRQMEDAMLCRAVEKLRLAKSLHDELEAVYRPHMDFAALDDFTEQTIRAVFG
ncbi:MAG: hypothetical protein IKI69_06955 [Oscillospiraceae bacterium]|nr:hypothetical protein [Oscillospiraceae bacterium]